MINIKVINYTRDGLVKFTKTDVSENLLPIIYNNKGRGKNKKNKNKAEIVWAAADLLIGGLAIKHMSLNITRQPFFIKNSSTIPGLCRFGSCYKAAVYCLKHSRSKPDSSLLLLLFSQYWSFFADQLIMNFIENVCGEKLATWRWVMSQLIVGTRMAVCGPLI